MPNTRSEVDRARSGAACHGLDFSGVAFVADPFPFSEPKLCDVRMVWNYDPNVVMARGQKNCGDHLVVVIAKKQEDFLDPPANDDSLFNWQGQCCLWL